MSMDRETSFFSSPAPTIPRVQGGLSVSLLVPSTSREGVPSATSYPTPYSLWIIPSTPPSLSLAQSTIGQPMITSQPCMSSVQSDIGPSPMANPRTILLPSLGTSFRSTIMSTTYYPFEWNCNNGVSAQSVNPIESVTPQSVLPYRGGSNALVVFPSHEAPIPLGVLPSLEVLMSLVYYIFLKMSIFLGSILCFGEPIP